MTSEEKADIKRYLLKEQSKIEKRILELKELTQPIAPDDAIGRVSRMDAINNKSINQTALRKSREKQNKIKLSLERIDDENFGNCIQCGQPIPIQRLMIVPGSVCIQCAGRG